MKKFLTIAAVVVCALLLWGCEKHAFTVSTNIFRVYNGKSTKDVTTNLSVKNGGTLYVFAASKDRERFTEGVYSAHGDANLEEHHVIAEPGNWNGDCIVIKAISRGDEEVTVNFNINGFHLYKTFTVSVK